MHLVWEARQSSEQSIIFEQWEVGRGVEWKRIKLYDDKGWTKKKKEKSESTKVGWRPLSMQFNSQWNVDGGKILLQHRSRYTS